MNVILLSILLVMGCSSFTFGLEAANTISKPFPVYHDINWPNVPADMPLIHMPDFNLATQSSVYWDIGDDINIDDPSENATKSYVMTFPYGQLRYLNIEHLPYRYNLSAPEQQLDTVRKLSMILNWAKTQRPDIEMGLFSMTVERVFDLWPPEYYERNKRFKALAEYSDVIYIDGYTWFKDQHTRWSDGFIVAVSEARKTNKKVFVFMWPHHQSPENAGILVPGGEWRAQLEEAYKLADGIVIWDKRTCDWNDIACADATNPNNWWYQTIDFIKQKGL